MKICLGTTRIREFLAVHFWQRLGWEHLLMRCFRFFYLFLGLAAPIGAWGSTFADMTHLSPPCSSISSMFIHVYPVFSVAPWLLQLSQPLPDQNSIEKTIQKNQREKERKSLSGNSQVHCMLPWCGKSPPYQDHSPAAEPRKIMSCQCINEKRLFQYLLYDAVCSPHNMLVPSRSISFHSFIFFLVVSQYRIPTSFCQVVPALMRRPSFPNFTAQPSGSFQSAAIFLAWKTNPFDSSMRQHATACEQKSQVLSDSSDIFR